MVIRINFHTLGLNFDGDKSIGPFIGLAGLSLGILFDSLVVGSVAQSCEFHHAQPSLELGPLMCASWIESRVPWSFSGPSSLYWTGLKTVFVGFPRIIPGPLNDSLVISFVASIGRSSPSTFCWTGQETVFFGDSLDQAMSCGKTCGPSYLGHLMDPAYSLGWKAVSFDALLGLAPPVILDRKSFSVGIPRIMLCSST